MKLRQRSDKGLVSLCDEVRPEDGIDPRRYFGSRSGSKNDSPDRKALQLCKQAAIAIDLALRGMDDHPLLGDLAVQRVDPGKDRSHLQVVVGVPPGTTAWQADAILAALNRQRGRLRAEVAATISRKRVPELSFRLAPCGSDRVTG